MLAGKSRLASPAMEYQLRWWQRTLMPKSACQSPIRLWSLKSVRQPVQPYNSESIHGRSN